MPFTVTTGGRRAMRVFMRADGSAQIGLGHVMRSLALAHWARACGAEVTYVMVGDPVACSLVERRGLGVSRLAAPGDQSWMSSVGTGDRVVFDGYPFLTSGVTREARARGAFVAVVDDHDGGDVECDLIVNPNVVEGSRYSRAARALCGPAYALVRPEFGGFRPARGGHGRTLLVTLGGSDAGGMTEAVLAAVESTNAFEHVVLVVGPVAAAPAARPWLEVVRDPDDVAAVFDRADAAVSAAGSTTWELCCLGVPSVLLEVVPNQRLVAMTAARAGAAFVAGSVSAVGAALAQLARADVRTRLSERALATVDGYGARRVAEALSGPQ
jgi:spore coat polysaccharide biosynthesis predicted glycosyltransferase SpsG